MSKREQVKHQIRFMCKLCDISFDEKFVDFVYKKNISGVIHGFSGEILKSLKKEYIESEMNK